MEQCVCCDNKRLFFSFLFQEQRHKSGSWLATLHGVSVGLRGPILSFHSSLKFDKSELSGFLQCTQMKASVDNIFTEEVKADGIYSGRQIEPYIPIWIFEWIHAVVTCNRLGIFSFSIPVNHLFSYFKHTPNFIWADHHKTQQTWWFIYSLVYEDVNTTRTQGLCFLFC